MSDFDANRLTVTGRAAFFGFCAIIAVFLITEHTAHVLGALPYLLLLACPLMHLFMHHGHHGHHDRGGHGSTEAQPPGSSRSDAARTVMGSDLHA